MKRFPLLILTLLTLSSCAGLAREVMREPKVDIVGAELEGADLRGANLLFEFEVENPNGLALVLDGIGYQLHLNERPLLSGRRDDRTEIAANGQSRFELPVTIRYDDALQALRGLSGDNPTYELRADFRFAVPVLGGVTVPVTKRGRVNLNRLLQSR